MELIDRVKLKEYLRNPELFNVTARTFEIINEQEEIDANIIVHAKWRHSDSGCECSNCGGKDYAKFKYCHVCGAWMDGDMYE